MNNRNKGQWGEFLAEKHLKALGYVILARQFSCRMGEIDIIARKGNTIVFVEVKSRSNSVYGRPCEAVTSHKQRKLQLTAQLYLQQQALEEWEVRFDVVEVYLDNDRVVHIEQAF